MAAGACGATTSIASGCTPSVLGTDRLWPAPRAPAACVRRPAQPHRREPTEGPWPGRCRSTPPSRRQPASCLRFVAQLEHVSLGEHRPSGRPRQQKSARQQPTSRRNGFCPSRRFGFTHEPCRRTVPDVYSVGRSRPRGRGLARARGANRRRRAWSDTIDGRFLSAAQAVRAVRASFGRPRFSDHALFADTPADSTRRPALPIALSGTLHVLIALTVLLVTTIGFARPGAVTTPSRSEMRLVFLALPGPAGAVAAAAGRSRRRRPRPSERASRRCGARFRCGRAAAASRPSAGRSAPASLRPRGRTAATVVAPGGPGRRGHARSRGRHHRTAAAAGEPRNRQPAAAPARARERGSVRGRAGVGTRVRRRHRRRPVSCRQRHQSAVGRCAR